MRARGIDIPVTKDKPYSMDRNLWHISYEEASWKTRGRADEEMFILTVSPEKAHGNGILGD